MSGDSDTHVWGPRDRGVELVAWNVSTRYLAIFVDGAIGLMVLPFNVAHLGPSAYGLWALTTSVTWFFGLLDLGYGGALVKFIAQYRAWRDQRALNETVSTICMVFVALSGVCLAVTAAIAWRIGSLFHLDAEQARTAQQLLLIIGAYLSVQFPISVFGGVVYGFQRYYRNNLVSIGTSLGVVAANVAVLSTGHGLVGLVAATTSVRLLSLGAIVWNAYRAFPGLQVRPSLFRRERLRDVTSFSVYMAVLDWSAKLNYSSDTIVIGAMLNTSAVALWTVGQRVTQLAQQLTNQLTGALFPAVVDRDAAQRHDDLRMILLHGTKLSLALAAPLCLGLIVLAEPLIHRWVGAQFSASVLPAQIMLTIVLVRNATASATVILKGAGQHRLLTYTNATTAVINVLLSVALVRPLGLLGVALGTLIPVAASSMFVLYPAACRRVRMPLSRPLVQAIWPAMWPAVIMVALLRLGQRLPATNLFEVALHLGVGGLVYLALFLGLAIGADERRFYWRKLRDLVARPPRVPAAA
jgi:O-antigen/teichoic acid export membrane protein